MANQSSVITYEKPLQHLQLDDWHSRLNQLRNIADVRRNDSCSLRNSARNLQNETNIQTNWDTYHNNARLSDRVAELDRWVAIMAATRQRIDKEIALLTNEKNSTEQELESMYVPLTVVAECLTMRDSRLGTELTYDDGDTELKNELHVIENNQKLLRDQCQSAWEKLNRLAEVKFKINLEITNKKEAQNVDELQLGIDKFCANITYKPDALRVPKNSCTYDGWLEHTNNMKSLADNELEDTYAMRESLFVSREKARNILMAQQERTEHIVRKRIFETQRARNELEWQLLKLKEEMNKSIDEIKRLEQALRDKTDALKLAETRLENRAQRSGMELCCDEVYEGLCNEVIRLRDTRRMLSEKMDMTKTVYTALEAHTNRIDQDLNNKQHSLMTDLRVLDLRSRLTTAPTNDGNNGRKSLASQTDRNIQLTKMENEIPKE